MSINWSYQAEQTVAGVLGMVPGVGSLLSALTFMLWPSTENVWDEIQQEVEALIQQDLAANEQEQIQDALTGLQAVIENYIKAIATGDGTYISENWTTANNLFIDQAPTFQDATYAVLLLPQFAQFGNLHLSLLRDGVLFGSSWGLQQSSVDDIQVLLTTTIASYVAYVDTTYQASFKPLFPGLLVPVIAPIPAPPLPVGSGAMSMGEILFLVNNTYNRQITRTVLDFATLWPYYDPATTQYPVTVVLTSEIYSDPMGTAQGWMGLPSPPLQPMQQLTMWGGSNIDAVQATYAPGGGPDGATTTPRLGDQDGGTNVPPQGGVFDVSTNPIVQVGVYLYGGEPSGVELQFQDGSTATVGGYDAQGAAYFSYEGQIVSSAFVNGVGTYNSADCIVFGFQYATGSTVNTDLVRTLFVSDPAQSSLDEVVARVPQGAIDAADVSACAVSEDWRGLREARWQSLGATAAHRRDEATPA